MFLIFISYSASNVKEKILFLTYLTHPQEENPKPLFILKLWLLLIELITGHKIELFTLLPMHKEI